MRLYETAAAKITGLAAKIIGLQELSESGQWVLPWCRDGDDSHERTAEEAVDEASVEPGSARIDLLHAIVGR